MRRKEGNREGGGERERGRGKKKIRQENPLQQQGSLPALLAASNSKNVALPSKGRALRAITCSQPAKQMDCVV